MTGSIRIFEKFNFTPKSSVFRFSQGQTSKYDRLAHQLLQGIISFPVEKKIKLQKGAFGLFTLSAQAG